MSRPRVMARLKRLWAAYRKRQQAGFTLIELLVAMFIGSIITVSLLALVVQLVDVNQRDSARSETQRDMQAAMNYIGQELREAVFVYDGDCLQGTATLNSNNFATECPGLINYIPASLSTPSNGDTPIPVLAFWRADPLPQSLLDTCKTSAQSGDWSVATPAAVQNVPCLSGRSYTLVVYLLVDDGNPNDLWQGRARIERYQLSQFTGNGTQTVGYVDPLSSPNSSFQQWPFQIATVNNVSSVSNAQTARPTGTSVVLVDYVDDGLLDAQVNRTALSCPDRATSTNPYAATPRSDFSLNPKKIRSFYACVRGKTYNAADTEQGVNQEVQLFLVGNVQGRPGFPLTASLPTGAIESQAFPSQTRVLTRGIINKSPK